LPYFIGPANFNRGLPAYVDTWAHAGYSKHSLSDLDLIPMVCEVNVEDRFVACAAEQDLFRVLGLLYLPPTQRGDS